jgi:hypothetical protein
MDELQRRPGEDALAWLERLGRVDESRLTEHCRRGLALCRGYAAYRATVEGPGGRPVGPERRDRR